MEPRVEPLRVPQATQIEPRPGEIVLDQPPGLAASLRLCLAATRPLSNWSGAAASQIVPSSFRTTAVPTRRAAAVVHVRLRPLNAAHSAARGVTPGRSNETPRSRREAYAS